MNLPLIDLFKKPYNQFYKHSSIPDPLMNPRDGAIYAWLTASIDNGFTMHIDEMISTQSHWHSYMPKRTPAALSDYQCRYPLYDQHLVDAAINDIGATLSEGQFVFHGGGWPTTKTPGATFVTNRPFSTTLCPNVAGAEAIHLGKAYKQGYVDICVLRVTNPQTNCYVFDEKSSFLGHENEVLFASGVQLKFIRQQFIQNTEVSDYIPGSLAAPKKNIPVYLVEAELS